MDDRKVTKLTCPYNVAHEIVPERFQGHLFKCREQYKVSEFTACPFNAAHDIPVPELSYHKQVCPDRLKIDKMRYRIGEAPEEVTNVVPNIDLPDDEDDWDSTPATSYLQIRDDIVENKPILRLPMGETKSKRKNFYQSEMFRFDEVNERGVTHVEPVPRAPKNTAAGRGGPNRHYREPSPDSRIGMGRGTGTRKPQSSVGEGSISSRVGSSSLRRAIDSMDEDNMSGVSASKASRIKEEPSDDDDDEGFQIVVSSKGRGRGKLK